MARRLAYWSANGAVVYEDELLLCVCGHKHLAHYLGGPCALARCPCEAFTDALKLAV